MNERVPLYDKTFLVNEEIDFQMTDWGRAAGVDSAAKVAMREQAKEQEKTRERQHGK